VPDPNQIATAVQRGELSCAAVPTSSTLVAPLRKTDGVAVRVGAGPTYLNLDFNEASGPFASAAQRALVAGLVDRSRVTAAVLAGIDAGAAPPANRFLVPGEAGYRADGPAPAPRGTYHGPALRLLSGRDVWSLAAAHAVAAELTRAGIPVTIVSASVPAALVGADWDLAVELRPLSPFPGPALAAYTSAVAVDGFSSPVVDALVRDAARSDGLARAVLIDRIDAALWSAHVDLPLLAVPDVVACQSGVDNVGPNPAPQGPAYDAQAWGVSSGAS
jgi:peptide/nickel transport system substrate-binding protein